jgi:hypothetical protein
VASTPISRASAPANSGITRRGTEHACGARARPDQAEQEAQRGRLARAVGAEKAVDLTPAHLQPDVVHHGATAVPLRQVRGLDQ